MYPTSYFVACVDVCVCGYACVCVCVSISGVCACACVLLFVCIHNKYNILKLKITSRSSKNDIGVAAVAEMKVRKLELVRVAIRTKCQQIFMTKQDQQTFGQYLITNKINK